jgi:aminoglycoside phosphotransferase (APT) family kinase protein
VTPTTDIVSYSEGAAASTAQRPEALQQAHAAVCAMAEALNVGIDRRWRITEIRCKRRKILFEIEETSARTTCLLYGKIASAERTQQSFDALQLLWTAGLRPPFRFRVPKPVGCLPGAGLLLQEKAAGDILSDCLDARSEGAVKNVAAAAEWVHTLHSVALTLREDVSFLDKLVASAQELCTVVRACAKRIEEICDAVLTQLSPENLGRTAPSHGDYHAKNVFVTDSAVVTGIDLDKLSAREPAADVAYFISQLACRYYRKTGSFEASAEYRNRFLNSYTDVAPKAAADRGKIAMYAAATFVRLIHYDVCLRKSSRTHVVDPWLRASTVSAIHGELDWENCV